MPETRNKRIAWNKGLTKEIAPQLSNSGVKKGQKAWNKGIPCSDGAKEKISKSCKGRFVWNKGKKMSNEYRENCRLRNLGKTLSKEHKRKIGASLKGHKGWSKGMKLSESTRKKMSLSRMGRTFSQESIEKMRVAQLGKKAHNWQGGKSFEPYPPEFNNKLKYFIRKKNNFTCQECNYTEEQLGYILSIHHIDYDKTNNNPNNLMALCKSCHSKTGFNREDWQNYFQQKIIEASPNA